MSWLASSITVCFVKSEHGQWIFCSFIYYPNEISHILLKEWYFSLVGIFQTNPYLSVLNPLKNVQILVQLLNASIFVFQVIITSRPTFSYTRHSEYTSSNFALSTHITYVYIPKHLYSKIILMPRRSCY